MTALAMIIGMVPMALGLGEGGEQNAPLGRAVIGGLLIATVATLFFVPVVFSVIRHKTRPREMADDPDLVSTQLELAHSALRKTHNPKHQRNKMNTQKLAGKVAIVTGASKGIGADIARHLAAEGASVVVNYADFKRRCRSRRR